MHKPQPEFEGLRDETFREHMWWGMSIVILIATIMFLLSQYTSVLNPWEKIGLDTLLRSVQYRSERSVIVDITEDDYRGLFKGQSPLDSTNVEKLILAVAAGAPKVIVVDLDTTDPRARTSRRPSPERIDEKIRALGKDLPPRVIWPEIPEPAISGERELKVLESPNDRRGNFALPLFPKDSDASVRGILPALPVRVPGGCAVWPTLPEAALEAYRAAPGEQVAKPQTVDCGREKEEDPSILYLSQNPSATFNHVDASSILHHGTASLVPIFGGKIALIGGTYPEARDNYQTAVGTLPGIDLVAFAIETLDGHARSPLQEKLALLVDLLLGAAILMVSYNFRSSALKAVLFSLATALGAPIICSYVVFQSGNRWMSFLPVILGAFLHIAYDCVKDLHRKEGEVDFWRQRAADLEAEQNVGEPAPAGLTVNVTAVINERGQSAGA